MIMYKLLTCNGDLFDPAVKTHAGLKKFYLDLLS